MLGDPRKLSQIDRQNFKEWISWLKGLELRQKYMSFRQDLLGFGKPSEGCWDGFMRINTDTQSGGLVGVFRQGSIEEERLINLKYLNPTNKYYIKEGKSGKTIAFMTGKALEEKGFKVNLREQYDGQLFEVIMQ
jgi:alpha-galactosidase